MDFVDFDGGVAAVLDNPQSSGINTSATVAQIVRDGGAVFAGSKITLAAPLDFTTLNTIRMKVFTTAPTGTVVKMKLEAPGISAERDQVTTVTGEWEELSWDFTGTPTSFTDLVFMFDFGNVGDGSSTSTFLFDDVEQFFGGNQIDLPIDFEDDMVNYSLTDFEGAQTFLEADPEDAGNSVIRFLKDGNAGEFAGVTLSTPSGLATNIPFTLMDARMTARVWSPDAGIPVRLKVENANDPTQTCETDVVTTVAGGWEVLDFIFTNEVPNTARLEFGLANGWIYNKASIFFNVGTSGASAGEKNYYFDNVAFGDFMVSTIDLTAIGLEVFPNPSAANWNFSAATERIESIVVHDLQGRQVLVRAPKALQASIDASMLPSGTYVARITTAAGTGIMKLVRR